MVSDIINGISNALYSNFEGVTIYTESIEQGFESPCFFIMPLNVSESPLMGARAFRNMAFDVHYFPMSERASNAEIQTIASKLFGVLKRIDLLNGDKLNGFKLRYEVENGVLHFFVEYKPTIRYPVDAVEAQGELTQTIGVKK